DTHQFTGSVLINGSVFSTFGYTGSLFGTSSYALTSSYFLGTLFQIATGSTTASVDVNASSVFLIKSSQKTIVSVNSTGSLTTSGSITVNTQGSFDKLVSVSNNNTEYFNVN
ncbi:MAG: hypothetical protein ACKO96_35165, partial [Flammeovirgaceae bacterium]